MNLLQETRNALARAGKGPEDVVWCGSKAGAYWFTWAQFEQLTDRDYNDSWGIENVAMDLVVVGADWWLERGEYDGSEWWDFRIRPTVKGDGIVPTPGQLFRTKGDYDWSSEIEPQPWRPDQ